MESSAFGATHNWQATTSVPSTSSHQGAGDRWKTSPFMRERGIFFTWYMYTVCLEAVNVLDFFGLNIDPSKKVVFQWKQGSSKGPGAYNVYVCIYIYMYGTRPHKSNLDVLLITLICIPWCFCNRGWVPHLAMHIDTYMNVSGFKKAQLKMETHCFFLNHPGIQPPLFGLGV